MLLLPFQFAFSTLGFYGPFLLLIVAQLLILILIPALVRPGNRPEEVAHAMFGYMIQVVGAAFMTAGGLPAFSSVLSKQPLPSSSYTALLILFAAGGTLFLWQDSALKRIDPAARAVPSSVFFYLWKFIGVMTVFLAGLSFMLELILDLRNLTAGWWVPHLLYFAYGLLLCWFTSVNPKPAHSSCSVTPMKTVSAASAKKHHKK